MGELVMKGQVKQASSICVYQGSSRLNKTDIPEVSATDLLVEVSVAAICLTDIYAATGKISCQDGIILGHEFVGRVVKVGRNANSIENEGVKIIV